jgi:hypothetical protein
MRAPDRKRTTPLAPLKVTELRLQTAALAPLDGKFWFGGTTSVNDVQNPFSEEMNSRPGGTVAVPITKHQSLKFSYSNGTYIRFGGNYQNVSVTRVLRQ